MAGYDMAVDAVSSSSAPSCSLTGPSTVIVPVHIKIRKHKGTGLHTRLKILSNYEAWNQTYEPLLCCVQVCVCEVLKRSPLTLIKFNKGVEGWVAWMVLVCGIEFWCALLRCGFPRIRTSGRAHMTSPQVGNSLSWEGHVHPRGSSMRRSELFEVK